MCTHEIWTYSECGCRIDHHNPCTPLSYSPQRLIKFQDTDNEASTSPQATRKAQQISDRAEYSFRSCSVHRTVEKSFLEPICEDCLMEELDHSKSNGHTDNQLALPAPSRSLVWDSDVKVEMDVTQSQSKEDVSQPFPRMSEPKILESNVEVRISDVGTERTQSSALSHDTQPHRTSTATPHANGDADSESSVPDTSFRGRARSRTKQLRRMAMDVSREDIRLRVSSRLPSFQRQSLQNFKNELQRDLRKAENPASGSSPTQNRARPIRNLVQRFADAQEETWKRSRRAMEGLGRKMVRKPETPTRSSEEESEPYWTINGKPEFQSRIVGPVRQVSNDLQATSESSGGDTGTRSNSDDSVPPENFYLHPDDTFHPSVQMPAKAIRDGGNDVSRLGNPWQDHLATDLTNVTHRRRRVQLPEAKADADDVFGGRAQMYEEPTKPSSSTTSTAVSRNWTTTHPSASSNPFSYDSYAYSTANEDGGSSMRSGDMKRRLLSASSMPLHPSLSTNEDASQLSDHFEEQRLASLVTSDDFDGPINGFSTHGLNGIEEEMAIVGLTDNPWRARSLSTMENLPDTPSKSSRHVPQTQVDTDCSKTPESSCRTHVIETPLTAIRGPNTSDIRQASDSSMVSFALRTNARTASRSPSLQEQNHHHTHNEDILLPPPTPNGFIHAKRFHHLGGHSPSPTPSPIFPNSSSDASNLLAIHSLSTPFHHSLQPRSPLPQSIETVLEEAEDCAELRTREEADLDGKSCKRTSPSKLQGAKFGNSPPPMPGNFALGASPTSLFSCVWVKKLCPGLDTGSEGAEEDESEMESPSNKGTTQTANTDMRSCGRITGQKVRSCLCSGIVRFAYEDTHSAPANFNRVDGVSVKSRSGGEESASEGRRPNGRDEPMCSKRAVSFCVDLDGECRSVAPVVRYVVSDDLCASCCRQDS